MMTASLAKYQMLIILETRDLLAILSYTLLFSSCARPAACRLLQRTYLAMQNPKEADVHATSATMTSTPATGPTATASNSDSQKASSKDDRGRGRARRDTRHRRRSAVAACHERHQSGQDRSRHGEPAGDMGVGRPHDAGQAS